MTRCSRDVARSTTATGVAAGNPPPPASAPARSRSMSAASRDTDMRKTAVRPGQKGATLRGTVSCFPWPVATTS